MGRADRVGRAIRSGTVWVNTFLIRDLTAPFGGMGISGNGGRFGAEANLDTFTQWQWLTVRDEPPSFPY